MSWPAIALVLAALGSVDDAPAGRRIALSDANLFIPDAYRPADATFAVLIHLHGAEKVVEAALAEAGGRAVLVEFNRKGLSSVYTKPFSDPKLFTKLLDETLAALKTLKLSTEPRLGRIVVSSFSAGFGGVRELLKVPEHFDRIDAIVLADSLYCGYRGDPALREVDPDLIGGFRRFAKAAAEGRKRMIVTHSAQVPPGYASTTETADDLIKAAGLSSETAAVDLGGGLRSVRKAERGGLLVLGFAGEGPEDHMRHLRSIGRIWKFRPDLLRPSVARP